MDKIYFHLIALCLLASNWVEPKNTTSNCNNVTIERAYTEPLSTNGSASYSHYLLLKNYSDECYDDISFSKLAKEYADTCTSKKPISIIHFITSAEGMHFESREPDYERIKENEVIGFAMNVNSASASIKKIYLIRNGVYKTIDLEQCNWEETLWK